MNTRPKGIIQFEEPLSDEEFDGALLRWKEQHKGMNLAHRVGVTMNARDAIEEKDWAATVVEAAIALRWSVWFTWSSVNSPKGEPDLRMCRDDRYILAELKSEDGVATPEQREALKILGRCKAVEAYLWRPSDWDDVQRILA